MDKSASHICRLFYDAVSNSHHTASYDWMVVNNSFERISIEVAMA
jgi:hypothetical protein